MSFDEALLEQARRLLSGRGRLNQADLRRAISGAYYALFHLLIRESTTQLLPPGSVGDLAQEPRVARGVVARWYDHGRMAAVCRWFAGVGSVPQAMLGLVHPPSVPADLRAVAQTFHDLQQERHTADYDLAAPITRQRAETAVMRAEQAFQLWPRARSTPYGGLFLLLLLSGESLAPKR